MFGSIRRKTTVGWTHSVLCISKPRVSGAYLSHHLHKTCRDSSDTKPSVLYVRLSCLRLVLLVLLLSRLCLCARRRRSPDRQVSSSPAQKAFRSALARVRRRPYRAGGDPKSASGGVVVLYPFRGPLSCVAQGNVQSAQPHPCASTSPRAMPYGATYLLHVVLRTRYAPPPRASF